MVGRSEGYLVLYPVYFDARATRAKGRRVPFAEAVGAPTAKAVFEAAKAAGLAPVLEDEHHHPSLWFEKAGRVLVPADQVASKSEAIRRIAQKLPAAHAALGASPGAKAHKGQKGKFAHKKHRRRRR